MRNGKSWPLLLILILLTALISFSNCKTPGRYNTDAALAALTPPLPISPAMEPVRFEDKDGGLWLSYDNYRALERNVIALREYTTKLEAVLKFYRED